MASTESPIRTTRYRCVFKELVSDEIDLVGLVAYALYKRQKIEWLKSIDETHGGRIDETVHEQLRQFCILPTQLGQYRAQASHLIESFIVTTTSQKLRALERSIRDDALIRAATKSFWRGVAEGIVSGVATLLLSVSLTGVAWVMVAGPDHLLQATLMKVLGHQ